MNREIRDYPRILFVTPCAFNRETGGGITFGNLFAGWPKERLATAHNDTVPVTTDVCDRYFELSTREICRWIPKPIQLISAVSEQSGSGVKAFASGQALRAARLVKSVVFGNGVPEKGVLTEELARWIDEFRPELLYTVLGSVGVVDLVDEVRREFRLPLAIHMMDDWPSSIYGGGLLSGVRRKSMHVKLSALMRHAELRIAICDWMARTFEERYGVPFVSYQNAVDLMRWQYLAKTDLSTGDTFRLLYVGSILDFAQTDSLIDCCRAVAALNAAGMPISFHIYSPDCGNEMVRRKVGIHDSIKLAGPITDDELFFQTLSDADLLVLPVNFDRQSVRHIKYSMPTKVPAYMASGTPILVYGPRSIAQTEYALRDGWGEVVSERGVENVKKAIRALAEDENMRCRLASAARRVVRENHDDSVVRAQFQQSLFAGVGDTGSWAEDTAANVGN